MSGVMSRDHGANKSKAMVLAFLYTILETSSKGGIPSESESDSRRRLVKRTEVAQIGWPPVPASMKPTAVTVAAEDAPDQLLLM